MPQNYTCKYCNEKVGLYLRHECIDQERIITSDDIVEVIEKGIDYEF